MEHPGMERLREHLRLHNRRVLALAIATLLVAAALWTGLYLAAWWLALLAGTAARPLDFTVNAAAMLRGFAALAVTLCVVAWIGRRLRPNEAARDDKSYGEHFADVILAVPRLTLAILGLSGAAARLSEQELRLAWELLRRMNERDAPVRISELPVEIPDARMRGKVLLALQVSGLVEMKPGADGPVLGFQNDQARRLAQERVRLRV